MKTQIKKNGDMVIVEMNGRLDFETNAPLREELTKLMRPTAPTRPQEDHLQSREARVRRLQRHLLFRSDDEGVQCERPNKPRYCNVKSEFKRVIKAFDEEQAVEFHDNEERAKKSFDQ